MFPKDDRSRGNLESQLRRIDKHLAEKGKRYIFLKRHPVYLNVERKVILPSFRFLTGDTMCCFDCELMPKLQHIRFYSEK